MEGTILEGMASFDFSLPISGTVVYDDDSDEDNNIPVKCCDDSSPAAIRRESKDMPLLDEIILDQNSRGTYDYNAANKKRKSSKFNKDTMCKKTKVSDNVPVKNEDISVTSHFFTGKEHNGLHLYPEVCVIDNAVNKTTCLLPIDSNNNTNNHTANVNHEMKNNDGFEDLNGYLKGIYDTISQNLISIFDAYQSHMKTVTQFKTGQKSNIVQNSKKRFMRLKNDYFNLSYCSAINVLLAKDSSTFTSSFLKNTVRYAKEKLNINCSEQDLQPIFYDLLEWAKIKKQTYQIVLESSGENQPQQVHRNPDATNNMPLLSRQLARPPVFPLSDYQNVQPSRPLEITDYSNVQIDRPPVLPEYHNVQRYRSALPNYVNTPRMKQPVLPDYSSVQRTVLPQYPNRQEPQIQVSKRTRPPVLPEYSSVKSTQSPQLPIYQNVQETTMNERKAQKIPIFNGGAPNREIIISVETATLRNQNHITQFPQDQPSVANVNYTESRNETNSSLDSNTDNIIRHIDNMINTLQNSRTYPSMYQSIYSAAAKGQDSHNLRNHRIQRPIQPPLACCENYNMSIQRPQSLNINSFNVNQTHNALTPANQSRQVDQLDQSIERSSVSTDSGFASPLQFNTVDGMVSSPEESQLGPFITHVTSLHPDAMHIVEGSCHVCRTHTKKMCLGCYQVYYCSTICQTAHWNDHANLCLKYRYG